MMALIVTSDGFLSTLSLRRATGLPTVPGVPGQHFYPRSPCGERRCYFLHFSALLQFLSTLSLRRATGFNQPQRRLYAISIHALLAESDWLLHRVHTQRRNFYPRSPCGERLQAGCFRINYNISIHALLAESDVAPASTFFQVLIFLSTLSLRRATWDLMGGLSCNAYFYPRSPCGERLGSRLYDMSAA